MNSKVGKRKTTTIDVKIEPPLKALKKSELIEEYQGLEKKFNDLKEKYCILLDSQKNHLEKISNLEETISEMKNRGDKFQENNPHLVHASIQTEAILCEECDYQAEEIRELVDHMHAEHIFEDYEHEYGWRCEHCEKGFHERKELMKHIKHDHIEKAKLCKFFAEGRCVFGTECWFNHDKDKVIEKFNCMFCDFNFDTKSKLMLHRKIEHPTRVKECNKMRSGDVNYVGTDMRKLKLRT